MNALFRSLRALGATTVHRLVPLQLASVGAYLALGASVIVVEEVAPVVAGFAAHQDHFPVVRTMIALAIGGWFATLAPYFLGRFGAVALLRRWPGLQQAVGQLTGVVARRPWRAALASRYVFGARVLLPLASGASSARLTTFLIGSAISASTWAVLYFWLGWLFGDAMILLLGRIRRQERLIALVLALVVLLILLVLQRKNRAHVAEELEGRLGEPPASSE